MLTLFQIENGLADAIATRTGRSTNDFAVRTAANASMGVLRAALRGERRRPQQSADVRVDHARHARLRGCFNALTSSAVWRGEC